MSFEKHCKQQTRSRADASRIYPKPSPPGHKTVATQPRSNNIPRHGSTAVFVQTWMTMFELKKTTRWQQFTVLLQCTFVTHDHDRTQILFLVQTPPTSEVISVPVRVVLPSSWVVMLFLSLCGGEVVFCSIYFTSLQEILSFDFTSLQFISVCLFFFKVNGRNVQTSQSAGGPESQQGPKRTRARLLPLPFWW